MTARWDLGDGRVLWLFGDSLVAKKLGATRRQSKFIRNSVAIQTGYDPSHATIKFYSALREGNTSDFLPPEGTNWFWPLHGIRLGDRLLLFFMRMTRDPNKDSLGFQSVGWNAFMVDNPTAEPSKWKPHKLDGFETTGKMLVGMSVIREGEHVYAFVLNDVGTSCLSASMASERSGGGTPFRASVVVRGGRRLAVKLCASPDCDSQCRKRLQRPT